MCLIRHLLTTDEDLDVVIYITKLFIVINVINEHPANLETITFTFIVSREYKKKHVYCMKICIYVLSCISVELLCYFVVLILFYDIFHVNTRIGM